MTGAQLASEREKKGWTQEEAASELGVSQPYLSLLERGNRRVTETLALRMAELYGLSPVALPLKSSLSAVQSTDEDNLAQDLAALGYPGFSYLKKTPCKKNPAEVLASALQASNLDSRLTEALPWVLLKFPVLNWQWLVSAAKLNDLQNRLGFVTSLARRLAERRGESAKAALLFGYESLLEPSKLAREDTLCHDSLTEAERSWLRHYRPSEAKHWRLLTDLALEHLSYD